MKMTEKEKDIYFFGVSYGLHALVDMMEENNRKMESAEDVIKLILECRFTADEVVKMRIHNEGRPPEETLQ